METKDKQQGYTSLIEKTLYKIIGCNSVNLVVKAAKTKKEIQAIAVDFRSEIEKRGNNVGYIKTSFASVVNKAKHFYSGKSDKTTLTRLKWIKEVFNVTENELNELKNNYTEKVQSRLESKDNFATNSLGETDTVTNFPLLVENAKKMLLSAKYQDVVTGLAFFTGRRMIEILFTGNFLKSKKKNMIIFTGVAKKGYAYNLQEKEKKTYEIPILIDSDTILKAIDRLNYLKNKNSIKEQILENRKKLILKENLPNGFITEMEITSLINDNFNKTINVSAAALLNECVSKVGKKKPTFHDLRKIYFCACVEKLRTKNETTSNYAKKILLHDTTETGQTYDTWIILDIDKYEF